MDAYCHRSYSTIHQKAAVSTYNIHTLYFQPTGQMSKEPPNRKAAKLTWKRFLKCNYTHKHMHTMNDIKLHLYKYRRTAIYTKLYTQNYIHKTIYMYFFLYSLKKNLLRIHTTYYATYNLLNNTTRTIPRSASFHDNSVSIDMNNK